MALGQRRDPYLGLNFRVEIEGLTVGGFSEVSGLQVETEVHELREGGENQFVHRLPGATRYPGNIVLKRGLIDTSLWAWYQQVIYGLVLRKNGSIILFDAGGAEVWRWNFAQAYPVKWSGPDLRASTGEVAIEAVELAHRGITVG